MPTIANQNWWIVFLCYTAIALSIDLFFAKKEVPKMNKALGWALFWVSSALIFCLILYWQFGSEVALSFLAGYLLEQSLSIDNIFVFVLIFSAFNVPKHLHHKVLFWGIIGAIFFRLLFITLGVQFVSQFEWSFYFLGAFLLFSAYRVFNDNKEKLDPMQHPAIKFLIKILPVRLEMHDRFFIKLENKRYATSLFLTVVCIEITDIVFALDSIPAIFSITQDPYLIFTSNIFAIMGLRNLYFLVAQLMEKSHYLNIALSSLLAFIGLKMLCYNFFHLPVAISLAVILLIIVITVIAELRYKPKE